MRFLEMLLIQREFQSSSRIVRN
ncbi:protein of unknown function [Sterolibacterium denitrificans]|uniref:Uncharacterized protein n=1 Tax=Sterolibacterium denitrificans TaxID=157592 RepID=A0A7Z7HPW6_9PROT|nr:protein of unknown function [Sterolibacterium denitrificans]